MLNNEYIYHLADPPPKLCDLNEYFTEYLKSRDDKYFYAFLHYYEKKLNANAKKFIDRYQIPIDCLDDLKQIFTAYLWKELQHYDIDDNIPLLQKIKRNIHRAWQDYVRTNCGAVNIPNANTYNDIRATAAIYFDLEGELSNDKIIKVICEKLNITADQANLYLETAISFLYSKHIEFEEDDDPNAIPEEIIIDDSNSAEDRYFEQCNLQKYIIAYNELSPLEQKILSDSCGIFFECLGNKPKKTHSQIALETGFASADAIEKRLKNILKKYKKLLI